MAARPRSSSDPRTPGQPGGRRRATGAGDKGTGGKGAAGRPAKQGRLKQLGQLFAMTYRVDKALPWWMLLVFAAVLLLAVGLGVAAHHPYYVGTLGLPVAVLGAMIILARRAERAAYASIAGQPGAAGAALKALRRGWTVEDRPAAMDPRTQDMVFRAVGRPGVVLLTEGPLPRVSRLSDAERKKVGRLAPNVPVHVLHAGDGDGQVPLRKVARAVGRLKPKMTKTEVVEVSRRLKAMGGIRPPIPKGVDPTRMRPDRKASRGR